MKLFNKKSFLNRLGLICLGLSLSFFVHAETLKLGHVTPEAHLWHKIAQKIDENLQANTNGEMNVAISPLSKIGDEGQMIQMMQAGSLHLGIFTLAEVANREASLQGWVLPFLFDTLDEAVAATQNEAARAMLAKLDNNGMVGVEYAFAGMRHIISGNAITEPTDLNNKKIRTYPSGVFKDWWNAVNAAPTAMPLSEVAQSLTTNLLDAVDIDLDALVSMKFYQQAPYLALTNHYTFPAVIVISKKYFDGLDESKKEVLVKAIRDGAEWGYKEIIVADERNLQTAIDDGATVTEIDLSSFKEAAEAVTQKYVKQDSLIADFYEQVQQAK